MIYTLCQRLIDHPRIGFEYDYMGAAEYEFGATYEARRDLARSDHERRACKVKTRNGAYSCTAVFPEERSEEMRSILTCLAKEDYRNKGAMDYSLQSQLGWLMLDPVPALIIINVPENLKRADLFLAHGAQLVKEREES